MFVKLLDGNEPVIVNSDAVQWIEGISSGQHCVVHMHGGSIRLPKPADEIQALLDWAAPSAKERTNARR